MSRSLRILVADDEQEMQTYFREILAELGHEVIGVACGGRELVAGALEHHPDLIVTDIRMPELDGIDATAEVYRHMAIPVILVSAYHEPDLISRAEADYIMAYLVKPIRSSHLQAAIALAMRRFERLQDLEKEAGDLRQALQDRKIIERAKGILMKQAKLNEEEAFKRLQTLASNRNQKMVTVAKLVLSMHDAFDPNVGGDESGTSGET